MYKYLALIGLLSGCDNGNLQALSIKAQYGFVSTIEGVSNNTYMAPHPSTDPYESESDVIQVNGLAGQFKLILNNSSDQTIKNVMVAVNINDATLIVNSLARIYDEIYWGGDLFNFQTPTQLPDGNTLCPKQYTGTYTNISADDLLPHSYIVFDSIVLGSPGLKLHFEAFGNLSDGHYALSCGETETSVVFNY